MLGLFPFTVPKDVWTSSSSTYSFFLFEIHPAATLGSTVFAALDELLPAAPWRRMLHGRMATRQLLRQQTSTAGSWQAGSHHHAKLVLDRPKKLVLENLAI